MAKVSKKFSKLAFLGDSLEKLSDKYGFWPWNRSAYADIIKYLENDNADLILMDFMFLGFQKCSFEPRIGINMLIVAAIALACHLAIIGIVW